MDMSRIKTIKMRLNGLLNEFFERSQRYRDTGLRGRYGVTFPIWGEAGST
jgi:hypothetical protein